MMGLTSRANSPSSLKLSWFECLLNPSLLDDYLNSMSKPMTGINSNQRSEEVEIISHFLANAGVSGQQQTTIPTNPTLTDSSVNGSQLMDTDSDALMIHIPSIEEETPAPPEKRKFRALKLLALKVAAFLKWDLEALENNLPLHMQSVLFKELKKTLSSVEITDWEEMSPHVCFAHYLQHRWTVRTVIRASYPSRPSKGINVQIPGQADPTWAPPETIETLVRIAKEGCQQATESLEKLMELLKNPEFVITMPLSDCFGTMSEENDQPVHDWSKGLVPAKDDVICQLAYDLGCIYFFNTRYLSAQTMFQLSHSLFPKLNEAVVSRLNITKLEGYVSACLHVVGGAFNTSSDDLNGASSSSLVAQLLKDASEGKQEIVQMLLDDNGKRKIPKSVRDRLEMDLWYRYGVSHPIYCKVVIANALRHALDGDVIFSDLRPVLSNSLNQEFFCMAIKSLIEKMTFVQKNLIQKFLQLLLSDYKDLTSKCQKSGIMEPFFGSRNPKCLKITKEKRITRIPRDFSFSEDPVAVRGRKERELISTRRVDSVSSLIKQLQKMNPSKGSSWSAVHLNEHWELPRSYDILLRALPLREQEETHVLLAKAIELRRAKCYEDARNLFKKVEQDAKEVPKLSVVIQWELCHTDLLQFINDLMAYNYPVDHPKRQAVLKQAKSCVSSYIDGREGHAKTELAELAIQILLNCQEWSLFLEMESQKGEPTLEFCRLLSLLCRGIETQRSNRSNTREFWDILLSFFLPSGQYKRSSSGSVKEAYREMQHENHKKTLILKFIRGLKGSMALGVIISGVIKIYNLLRDDSSQELAGEHHQLWPSALGNANHYNVSMVTQVLQDLLHQALLANPTNPSWLNAQADLMYVQAHYAAAMKQYISMGASNSYYFSQPFPKYLFHDQQIKRMIQCCSKIQCYTQAAVLTQFLEEPNYTLAFKVLSEKVCSDSCNSHYAHIWEIPLLEFLVNLHARRGETERRILAQRQMGLLELNANNNEEIQREAANIRKGQFFRAMAKQYL